MLRKFFQSAFGGADELHTSRRRYSQLESSVLDTLLDEQLEEVMRDRYTKFEDQISIVASLPPAGAMPRGQEGIPGRDCLRKFLELLQETQNDHTTRKGAVRSCRGTISSDKPSLRQQDEHRRRRHHVQHVN